MSELPWRCSACGYENMVEVARLERRASPDGRADHGFVCSECSQWNHLYYDSPAMEKLLGRLSKYSPGQPEFNFWMGKAVRRIEAAQEARKGRGEI